MKIINNYKYPNIIKYPLRSNLQMGFAEPLNGLDIGIPLNIFQNIFTNLHYGYDIASIKSTGIQFLLGYYVYGKDRYNDAIEYINDPYETEKEDFYKSLYKNKNLYDITFNLTFLAIICLLLNENTLNDIIYNLPFIPLIYINSEYKNFKKQLDIFKPLYIGISWTIASIIIPCVLYEHNYAILNYPTDYIPCILTLFSTSNFADVSDIDEDKVKNINTIPVKFGKKYSNTISFIALIISSILLIENPNYELRPIVNSIVEIQNFAIMGILYNNTFN
jgi:hypothetical protein